MTPENAFGGPVTVALNQAQELMRRGHHVEILGGCSGYPSDPPSTIRGVPVRLFPVRRVLPGSGFSGISSFRLLREIRRAARAFDVVHVHLARDLITLPSAAIAQARGVAVIAQTHGMIDPSTRWLSKPLDALLTRRVLRRAKSVLYLTPEELNGLRDVQRGKSINARPLVNGVAVPDAVAAPTSNEVLFCGRLHARKRPTLFAESAAELIAEGLDATFRLVGTDEGEGARVREVIAKVDRYGALIWDGPVPGDQVLEHMTNALFMVLPSVDEPYPMAVIEALALGLPVIVTDSCGLAPIIEKGGCGVVIDRSRASLTEAMRLLITDVALREQMTERARDVAQQDFSIGAVVDTLENIYRSASSGGQR